MASPGQGGLGSSFGIILLVLLFLVRESTSMYEWKCSRYDSANDKYYLPYFGETSQVFQLTWEPSPVGVTYIYPINSNELNCTGLVTALEFCYTTTLSPNNPTSRKFFNFQMLNMKIGNVFEVKKTIPVAATPTANCTNSNQRRCCEIMQFDTQDQFNITSPNLAFAIVPQKGNNKVILQGLYEDMYPMYSGLFYEYSNPLMDTTTLDSPVNQSLRLAWLHVVPPVPEVPKVTSTKNSELNTSPINPETENPSSSGISDALEGSTSSSNELSPGSIGAVIVTLVIIIAVIIAIVVAVFIYKRGRTVKVENATNGMLMNNVIQNEEQAVEFNEVPAAYDYSYYYTDTGPIGNGLGNLGAEVYYSLISEKQPASVPQHEDIQPQVYEIPSHNTNESYADEYDDIYVEPARDVGGLYAQLERTTTDTVSRDNIRLGDYLGSGQFGEVFRGVWECSKKNVEVAVKTLKEGSSDEDRIKFLQEAAIMCQFRHPNVVTMYGVVTDGDPILLVLEILKEGDLRDYLLSMRRRDTGGLSPEISGSVLLSYCRQVALGMLYLSNKLFVHRDLAARNILVSDDGVCKISDFGMSRDLADENYYVSHGGKIPIKWTAPEALFYKKYSTCSDVWSYGALMFEIWSVGHKPFEARSNAEIIQLLNSGYRLPPPPGCPRAIYSIMMSCWHPESKARPNFSDLTSQLSGSEFMLLLWSEVDKSEFPSATELGADLSLSTELFKDLQGKYCNQ